MDVSGTIEKILCQKSGEIWSISPDATVYDAIALMAEKNVGALLVMENETTGRHRFRTRLLAQSDAARQDFSRQHRARNHDAAN